MIIKKFMELVWRHINVFRFFLKIGYIVFSLLNVFSPNDAFDTAASVFEHFKDV